MTKPLHVGRAAELALGNGVYDLVLLDIWMPDVDGITLLREWSNGESARCPVVMMSGHVPEMMDTAQKYRNVVATIAKPFMSDALVDAINRYDQIEEVFAGRIGSDRQFPIFVCHDRGTRMISARTRC